MNNQSPIPAYKLEHYRKEADAAEFIGAFHNSEYFLSLCRKCPNFGRRHGCPPFDYNPLELLSKYSKVRITGIKIILEHLDIPMDEAFELIMPAIADLNRELLEDERKLDGMALGFVNKCPYCNGKPCARISGKECRHKNKVRPSLEAFGFDVEKIAKEILGIEIKWGVNGRNPEYLTLVCAVFY